MSTVWRLRIDEATLEKADQVTGRLGTSTQEMVRLFVAQIANTGRVPLQLNANDELVDLKRRNANLLALDDSEGW
jgi:addiction module RelB/DinJ family antitoxin